MESAISLKPPRPLWPRWRSLNERTQALVSGCPMRRGEVSQQEYRKVVRGQPLFQVSGLRRRLRSTLNACDRRLNPKTFRSFSPFALLQPFFRRGGGRMFWRAPPMGTKIGSTWYSTIGLAANPKGFGINTGTIFWRSAGAKSLGRKTSTLWSCEETSPRLFWRRSKRFYRCHEEPSIEMLREPMFRPVMCW